MDSNQTAFEIAREYETLAINSANQHFYAKRRSPLEEFPALAAHVTFCMTMYTVWHEVAMALDKGPWISETQEISDEEWGHP